MKLFREAFTMIQRDRKIFNLINFGYFSIIILGMLIIRTSPTLKQELINLIGEAFTTGPMQYVTGAYSNGEAISAIGLTFLVNLFLGCFIALTLPSMIIPFSGFVVGIFRALIWGFIFSPEVGDLSLLKILMGIGVGLLLVFEGEAYVLTLFAAFLQGRALVKPTSVGVDEYSQGYMVGLRQTLRLYPLIICMLLIAAIYEVLLVIVILPGAV